jgi:hypothetical protein
MMKGLEDFELTIFVALILKDLLDSNCLTSFCNCCLEDYSERPIAYDFLSIISETLNMGLRTVSHVPWALLSAAWTTGPFAAFALHQAAT